MFQAKKHLCSRKNMDFTLQKREINSRRFCIISIYNHDIIRHNGADRAYVIRLGVLDTVVLDLTCEENPLSLPTVLEARFTQAILEDDHPMPDCFLQHTADFITIMYVGRLNKKIIIPE
jgi:hypothetical protein